MKKEHLAKVTAFQKNEITEYQVYKILSSLAKDSQNRQILSRIAQDEYRHYGFWKKYTGIQVAPDKFKVGLYTGIAKTLGLTFAVKLMEMGEGEAQISYKEFSRILPEVKDLITDEDRHERETLAYIHDQYLKYARSIVLGLNDALVELTGALAGLTLALQNSRLIAVTGLITGVAAALSMGVSDFLSIRAEEKSMQHAFRSSTYTGTVYMAVVLLLITPYLILSNVFLSLIITLITALLIIAAFSFYVSVAQQISFKKQFLLMTALSMGVASVSFFLGLIIRNTFDITV